MSERRAENELLKTCIRELRHAYSETIGRVDVASKWLNDSSLWDTESYRGDLAEGQTIWEFIEEPWRRADERVKEMLDAAATRLNKEEGAET